MEEQTGSSGPTQDQLTRMEILEGLPAEILGVVAARLYPRRFAEGEEIFAEGSVGDVMYLIEAGNVRLGSDVGLERETLAVLGPGEHFGEQALLENGRQYAWARAENDVDVWVLYKPDFDNLLAECPPLYANITRSLSRRLAEADRVVEPVTTPPTPSSVVRLIKEHWHAHVAFGHLAMLRMLVGAVFISTAFENLHKGLYGPGFQSFVESWATGNPIGLYHTFLESVVIPNWQIFATVQLIVEPIVMGLFLLIGLFTRASAFVAAFFIANLFMASLGKEWPWTYVVILGVLIALITSRAGRCLGVDQLLAERYPNPRIPLW